MTVRKGLSHSGRERNGFGFVKWKEFLLENMFEKKKKSRDESFVKTRLANNKKLEKNVIRMNTNLDWLDDEKGQLSSLSLEELFSTTTLPCHAVWLILSKSSRESGLLNLDSKWSKERDEQ